MNEVKEKIGRWTVLKNKFDPGELSGKPELLTHLHKPPVRKSCA